MPIKVERAREGGANVRVFVHNGTAYLTLMPSLSLSKHGVGEV